MSEDTRFYAVLWGLALFITGAGFGAAEAWDAGKCTYTRPISFFPSRVIGCELLRDYKP